MPEFTIAIVERPALKTAGLKVATDMQQCAADCSRLWEKEFGPRMMNFPADPKYPNESYGVSIMIDQNRFDYWAVMPLREGATIPEGMEPLDIAGGIYAECRLNSLKELGDAYNYIYTDWAPKQDKHVLNMQGACYELYTPDFMKTGMFTIYCPLLGK